MIYEIKSKSCYINKVELKSLIMSKAIADNIMALEDKYSKDFNDKEIVQIYKHAIKDIEGINLTISQDRIMDMIEGFGVDIETCNSLETMLIQHVTLPNVNKAEYFEAFDNLRLNLISYLEEKGVDDI